MCIGNVGNPPSSHRCSNSSVKLPSNIFFNIIIIVKKGPSRCDNDAHHLCRQKKSSRRTRSPGKQHHTPSSDAKFNYDERHLAKFRSGAVGGSTTTRMTPPLPDLRVDFAPERRGSEQVDRIALPSFDKRGSVCLNKCLREVGSHMDQTINAINVTTNPLEAQTPHFSSPSNKKNAAATIVVQQASVSENISTILLKSGAEFVSNVQQDKTRKKEENMKQLLDVANNLTLEEIHDFEMR
nr:unnamed protein product [Callosobruchus chinensis]